MRFKIPAWTLFLVLFLLPLYSFGQHIPKSIKVLHKILTTDCGYEYDKALSRKAPRNVLVYTKWKSMVTVGFDAKGVKSGAVLFMPGGNTAKTATALSAIYLILQVRMGKKVPSKHNAYLKGRRLIDTVVHNLKLIDKTSFPFDDLMVTAEKYPKEQSISIRLAPW